jgi:hypothetical protein
MIMLFLRCFAQRPQGLLLLLFLAFGCSHTHIPEVSVQPSKNYRMCQDVAGLIVGADLYVEEDRLKEYFGKNLVQKNNILPVLVVLENRHLRDGYLIEGGQISLALRQGAARAEEGQATVPVTDKTGALSTAVVPLAIAGVLFTPAALAGIALLPFLAAAERQRDVAVQINDNLTKKALTDRTLYPGEVHSGFVYFPLSSPAMVSDIAAVEVKVKNLKTSQLMKVVLPVR